MMIPSINFETKTKEIVNFLIKEFNKRNKIKAIIGVSGGIDSSLVVFLCKKSKLDLYPIILPYKNSGDNGKKLIGSLKIPLSHVIEVDITSLVDETIKELEKKIILDEVDRGNIMARQRMIIQYSLARSLNGLVVGTENLSEYYLGYFTLHGDQACDINPISNLWKTQVYGLAKYVDLPKWILSKKPSADLWDGQTDEKELGFSYESADQILYLYVILKYSKDKIILKYNFNPELVKKVLERFKETSYKREGAVNFGKEIKYN